MAKESYQWYCWIKYLRPDRKNMFSNIWVWYVTDKWINSDVVTLTGNRTDYKWRKEMIKERERLLNDLKKAPIYKEWLDWIYIMESPYKWK